MNLYRIQTYKFESGLNFFQKAILRFKAKPGISNEKIAELLGLDVRLVYMVESELRAQQLLDSSGVFTSKAKELLGDIDNIIIDKTRTQIGYVLQYLNDDELYPYYIINLGSEPNLDINGDIVTGTKGDGMDYVKKAYDFSLNFKEGLVCAAPDEYRIIESIKRTRQKSKETDTDVDLGDALALKYFQDNQSPLKALVYTYVYLPKKEEGDVYDTDWQVQDPFFPDCNNPQLKYYLKNLQDQRFNVVLEKNFNDAKTIMEKRFQEYQVIKEQEIDELIHQDYMFGYERLPYSLQEKIRSLISAYIDVLQSQYANIDYVHTFLNTIQKSLETLLCLDIEKLRPHIYEQLANEYGESKEMSKADRDFIQKKRMNDIKKCTMDFKNPFGVKNSKDFFFTAKNINPANMFSLKHYLCGMILTTWYEKDSIMFKSFNGHVDTIIQLANLRNSDAAHGSLKINKKISKEEIETYYNSYKSIINNFIHYSYGKK